MTDVEELKDDEYITLYPISIWFDGGDTETYILETQGEPSVVISQKYEKELEEECKKLNILEKLYNGEIVEVNSSVIAKIWHKSNEEST